MAKRMSSIPLSWQGADERLRLQIKTDPIYEHGSQEADERDDILHAFMLVTDVLAEQAFDFVQRKETIMANAMTTPAKNRQILSKLADQFMRNASKHVDDCFVDYAKMLANHEAGITPAELKPVVSASITNALINMSAENRRKALDAADPEVFSAVALSHPIVSGMTREDHDGFKARYLARQYPTETKRIARARKAYAHMSEQIADQIIPYYRSQVDHRAIAADLVKAEAAAEAARVDGS